MSIAQQIAIEFSRNLREYAADGEIEQCIRDNRAETDKSVCHSHDFCDANVAMDEAFGVVTGKPASDDLNDESTLALWAEAWDIAKQAEFAIE